MTKIIDLLNVGKKNVSASNTNESTSMVNDRVGICPKCSKVMSTAKIINNEDCFYCESCRVAAPKPNIG